MFANGKIEGSATRPTFDNLNRLTEEMTPQGSVSYAYDAANRRTSMTVAGQTAVNYTYDNANRLTGIAQGSSTVSLAFDNADRRTSLMLPNGVVMSYGYDTASQLTGLTYTSGSTTLGNLSYGYDLAGRRTSMGGSLAAVNFPIGVSLTSYNANNQLTQWGTANLYYDANGNMTSDGVNSYVWDGRNHLTSMDASMIGFQYDGFGRRTGKTVLGVTTNYLYDGANVVQELSGTTPTANLLTGGVDEYFTRTDSNGAANFMRDALGSTLALTNSSGSTIASYTYEPFGNTTSTGSTTNTYQFTGRENDDTGLYYYRARFYSPTLQRFISEDPLGMVGSGPNLYAYAFNSPANLTDPTGEDGQTALACAFFFYLMPANCDIFHILQPAPPNTSGRKNQYQTCFGGDAICDASGHIVRDGLGGPQTDPIPILLLGGEAAAGFDAAAASAAGDDSAAYQNYWNNLGGRAPVQSSPNNIILQYDEDGNVTGATTYDQFGDRAYQYEFGDDARHGAGYHSYDNSGPYTGYGNGPRSPHIPF